MPPKFEIVKDTKKTETGVNDIGKALKGLEGPLKSISDIFGGIEDKTRNILKNVKETEKIEKKKDKDKNDKVSEFNKLLQEGKDKLADTIPFGDKMKEIYESFSESTKDTITGTAQLGLGFALLLAIATQFSAVTGEIGDKFGAIGVTQFRTELGSANIEAIKLGKGFGDVASVIDNMAADFGVGFEEAIGMSGAILDTSVALGLSAEEGSKLVGSLSAVTGLSAESTQNFAKQTALLAAAENVSPVGVMKDIAGSSETIANFTAAGGENIGKAAIMASKLGVNLNTVAGQAEKLLDFQSSIGNELEASVLIGRNINLQKARELALSNDLEGMTAEIVKQVGSQEEFEKMNVIQRKALADAVGLSTVELTKYVSNQDRALTLQQAIAGTKGFEELVGKDAIGDIENVMNSFKAIGASLVEVIGPTLSVVTGIVSNIVGFLAESKIGMVALASATAFFAVKSIAAGIGKIWASSMLMPGGPLIGIPTALGAVAALFAGIKAIPMAEGGVVTGETLTTIGEAGPEAVFPLDVFFTQMNRMFQRSTESTVNAITNQKLVTNISNKDLNIALTPSNA